MKYTIKCGIDFEACFEEPGSDKMIRYELTLRWRVPGYMRADELVLLVNAESAFCLDAEFMHMAGIRLRWCEGYQAIKLGSRGDRRKVKIIRHGSGGNMYWESFHIHGASRPHLINFLRRQRIYSLSEWDTDFVDQVWHRRQSIDKAFLRAWARKTVKADLLDDSFRAWLKSQEAAQ